MNDDELQTAAFDESELCHVTTPGACPLCGRMTLPKDTGGTWCPDEDSTCWRGGQAAIKALELISIGIDTGSANGRSTPSFMALSATSSPGTTITRTATIAPGCA